MWAFIIAILTFLGFTILAFYVGTRQSEFGTPSITSNAPFNIFSVGVSLALLIAASHWFSWLGW